MDTSIEFLTLVRGTLPPERYDAFLKLMVSVKEKRMTSATLYKQVEDLFKEHQKLMLGINRFFGKDSNFITNDSEREATVNKFLDKVKAQDKVLYAKFLTMQDDYLNSTETIAINDFCQKVAELFQRHGDLFKEYESLLHDDPESDRVQPASFGRNCSGFSLIDRSIDVGHLTSQEKEEETDNQRRSKRLKRKMGINKVMEQLHRSRAQESSINSDCNPSYNFVENYSMSEASDIEDRNASVLNDSLKLIPFSNFGGSNCDKQSAEDDLEDARVELDVLIEWFKKAAEDAKNLLAWIQKIEIGPDEEIEMEQHFTAVSIRCIEQLYQHYSVEMLDLLKKNAAQTLPVLLERLDGKIKEARNYKVHFNKNMKCR